MAINHAELFLISQNKKGMEVEPLISASGASSIQENGDPNLGLSKANIETLHGTLVDNSESTFFSWVTVASIFLAAALVFPNGNILYTLAFLFISIVLLLLGAMDYLNESSLLTRAGYPISSRLRLLYFVVILILIIEVVLFIDLLFRGDTSGKSGQSK